MKILFLDIDGVLNSIDNDYALCALWEIDKANKSRDEFGVLFDERCVRWLKWIIEKTGCKIVLSSTWRMKGLREIQTMWEMRDLPGEVISITPTSVSMEIINLYAATNNDADRGYEIQEWLNNNKKWLKYCIVDDDNDMLKNQNFVRTEKQIGLNYKTAHSIMAILNSI